MSFARAFRPALGLADYHGCWSGDGRISTTITAPFGREEAVEMVLDPRLGFARARVGEEELRLEAFHYGSATPQAADSTEATPEAAPLTGELLRSA